MTLSPSKGTPGAFDLTLFRNLAGHEAVGKALAARVRGHHAANPLELSPNTLR